MKKSITFCHWFWTSVSAFCVQMQWSQVHKCSFGGHWLSIACSPTTRLRFRVGAKLFWESSGCFIPQMRTRVLQCTKEFGWDKSSQNSLSGWINCMLLCVSARDLSCLRRLKMFFVAEFSSTKKRQKSCSPKSCAKSNDTQWNRHCGRHRHEIVASASNCIPGYKLNGKDLVCEDDYIGRCLGKWKKMLQCL